MTIRLKERTVAWQNSKAVLCKMHAFFQNAISFELLYSGFVLISKLYIYKSSAVYLSSVGLLLFCKTEELRNPTNTN